MAGVRPFFLTGANAKIKVNGTTLAYCTNVAYSIDVNHTTPTLLGMYEPSSVEPLSYKVSGTFSVVRYIADATTSTGGKSPTNVNGKGNGIGGWGSDNISIANLADGRAYENLIPAKMQTATTFNIEILQKTETGTIGVANIRDARITRADFSLSKKAAATQTFAFTALYADEDSFLADFSGLGQQFL